jgi:hypothetical protein
MHDLTSLQLSVLGIVEMYTQEKPILGKDIANRIGLKDRDSNKEGADLRSIVNALRVKGYPICASSRGYYYPRNERELDEYIESLEGRIRAEQKAVDGLRVAKMAFAPKPKQSIETSLF